MVVFAFHAKTPAMDKASFIYKEAKYVVYWILMFSTGKKKKKQKERGKLQSWRYNTLSRGGEERHSWGHTLKPEGKEKMRYMEKVKYGEKCIPDRWKNKEQFPESGK